MLENRLTMLEDRLGNQPSDFSSAGASQSANFASANAGRRWPVGILLCTLGFLVCILLTVTPLIRVPDPVLKLHIAAGSLLALASSWLPTSPGTIAQNAYGELFLLLALASLCYGCAALLIQRRTGFNQRWIRNCIWIGVLLAGAIYTITPGMLSHDILVYASYSRVLTAYHANPYFIPIAAYPHDPFTPVDYWRKAVSAYGPLWMLICAFWGWLLSPEPAIYVVGFRAFALAIHLLNTWLVGRTLQTMKRSPQTVTLGMLLYAWNPLVLLESSLGGHNDVFMLTFVLAGILLAVQAEQRGQALRVRGYVPVIITLTLAALVKFTALPIVGAYLLFLGCKALQPATAGAQHNWAKAIYTLLWSALAALLVTLLFYGPFWLGHSVVTIIKSFQNPPSAIGAENSFLRSLIEWLKHHPVYWTNGLVEFVNNRRLWDILTYIAIVLCLIVGMVKFWPRPTVRRVVVVALATMSVVLLITPWFYSWYVTWIIGLAVLCLPVRPHRTSAALLAFTFTFSFSALLTYLFYGGLFDPRNYLDSLFTTIPPVCAFLLTLLLWQPVNKSNRGGATQ